MSSIDLYNISEQAPSGTYLTGQLVKLVIKDKTDLGFKAIVDGRYWGVLYFNEVFQELNRNQEIDGYIKKLRPDGKIDLTLYKTGYNACADVATKIIQDLEREGGYLKLTDKTDPEEIYDLYGISKKKFKMALGGLYKRKLINIKDDGIYLVQKISRKEIYD